MAHAAQGLRDLQLQELLLEVNSLSNRVKWQESPNTMLPAGGRAVLQCLAAEGPQTVPQLARARCTSRQNAQILVNRLKQRSLVEIVPNPSHQRSSLVKATPAGLGFIESLLGEQRQLTKAAQTVCTAEEISNATSVLRRLRNIIGETPAALNIRRPAQKNPIGSRSTAPASVPPPDFGLPVNLL